MTAGTVARTSRVANSFCHNKFGGKSGYLPRLSVGAPVFPIGRDPLRQRVSGGVFDRVTPRDAVAASDIFAFQWPESFSSGPILGFSLHLLLAQ